MDPVGDVRNLAEAELLRARASARSFAKQSIFHVFAVLMALVGFVMLSVAGVLALSQALGPVNGVLIGGGLMLFVALVALLIARPMSRSADLEDAERAARSARASLSDDAAQLQSVMRILQGDFSEWNSENRTSVLMAAFGAGLGLGMNSRRRSGDG